VKDFDNWGRNVDQLSLFRSQQLGTDYEANIYHVMLVNAGDVSKTVKMIKKY